ncbi:hypothetical protein [Nocardiopsis valliformis]|uniref:hypothetical protein n=1 Tax=Nocardiopsis valliformis TaxID=239974 RepID=UPI001EF9E6F9|nr:hypothetical protein [Nocardiopsis valliformis]
MQSAMFNDDCGLSPGQVVESAFAVVFREDPSPMDGSAEGVELVIAEGGSFLLWNRTDWTLEVTQGDWPGLPAWAWPEESWEFVAMPGPVGEGAGEILSVVPTRNRVGEINGVLLEFPCFRWELTSGDSLSWAVIDKTPEG